MKTTLLAAFFAVLLAIPVSADPPAGKLMLSSKREWRTVKPELYITPLPRFGAPRWMPMARQQIVPGVNSPYAPMQLQRKSYVPMQLQRKRYPPMSVIMTVLHTKWGDIQITSGHD